MEDSAALVDAIILVAGVVLILLASVRVSRRYSRGKSAKDPAGTLIGVAIGLGCLGVALYLIFG